MKFSKRKYLQYLSEKFGSLGIQSLSGFVAMDDFSSDSIAKVLEENIFPTKDYFDFCWFVEEYYSPWEGNQSLEVDYLFLYMGSVYLYCSSKLEDGYSPDITSLYVRAGVNTFRKYNDEGGAEKFYNFLSDIEPANEFVRYFLVLGKIFLYRCFPEKGFDLSSDCQEFESVYRNIKDLPMSFVTDSVECPDAWLEMNIDLPIPETMSELDILGFVLS